MASLAELGEISKASEEQHRKRGAWATAGAVGTGYVAADQLGRWDGNKRWAKMRHQDALADKMHAITHGVSGNQHAAEMWHRIGDDSFRDAAIARKAARKHGKWALAAAVPTVALGGTAAWQVRQANRKKAAR